MHGCGFHLGIGRVHAEPSCSNVLARLHALAACKGYMVGWPMPRGHGHLPLVPLFCRRAHSGPPHHRACMLAQVDSEGQVECEDCSLVAQHGSALAVLGTGSKATLRSCDIKVGAPS